MATKLFLRNSTNNGITDSGDGILYDMLAAAGSASDTSVTNTAASGTQIQLTETAGGPTIAFISGRAPAGGFTLTTTDISVWMHESNMLANCGGRFRVFKRTGAGVITELVGGPFNDGVEFGTAAAEMTWPGNVTDTAFAEDDRILLRIYLTNVGTMASGHTCTLTFNTADGTTGDSFFNIAETITFKTDSVDALTSPSAQSITASQPSPALSGGADSSPSAQSVVASLPAPVISGGAVAGPSKRGIVFDSASSQRASRDFPNSAPWNSMPGFQIVFKARNITNENTSGRPFTWEGPTHNIVLVQSSGRVDFSDSRDGVSIFHTPNSLDDFICKLQFDPANTRWTMETWRAGGTNRVSGTVALTTTSNYDLSGGLFLASNSAGGSLLGVTYDWVYIKETVDALDVFPGDEPAAGTYLAKWDFDTNDGSDSSGNSQTLTLTGGPTFEDTPGGAGISAVSLVASQQTAIASAGGLSPTVNVTVQAITPSQPTITASGGAQSDAGALSATASQQSAGTEGTASASPSVQALLLEQISPTLNVGSSITPAALSLIMETPAAVTGGASQVDALALAAAFNAEAAIASGGGQGQTVNVSVETLAPSLPAPAVSGGAQSDAGAQALTLSLPAHSLSAGVSLAMAAQALVSSLPAPSAQAAAETQAGAQGAALSQQSPALSGGAQSSPSALAVSLSQPAASSFGAASNSPDALGASFALQAPTLSALGLHEAGALGLVLSQQAANAQGAAIMEAAAQSLTLGLQAVTISASGSFSPEALAVIISQQEATASAGGNVSFNAPALSIVASLPAASIQAGVSLAAVAQALVASQPEAIAGAGASALAAALSALFSAPDATAIGGGSVTFNAPALSLIGSLPDVEARVSIAHEVLALALSASLPSLQLTSGGASTAPGAQALLASLPELLAAFAIAIVTISDKSSVSLKITDRPGLVTALEPEAPASVILDSRARVSIKLKTEVFQ